MIYKSTDYNGQKVDPHVLANETLTVNARWLYSILCFLEPQEDYTDCVLADLLSIKPRTLINLRNELQEQGYIKKIRNGRVIHVFLGNSEVSPNDVIHSWS